MACLDVSVIQMQILKTLSWRVVVFTSHLPVNTDGAHIRNPSRFRLVPRKSVELSLLTLPVLSHSVATNVEMQLEVKWRDRLTVADQAEISALTSRRARSMTLRVSAATAPSDTSPQ